MLFPDLFCAFVDPSVAARRPGVPRQRVFSCVFPAKPRDPIAEMQPRPARATSRHFNAGVEQRHVLPASAARAGPLFSSLRQVVRSATMPNNAQIVAPSHNSIRVEIVTTYEQLLHAYAIRSICFIEENGMKAQQMFDGNDYQATKD